MISIIICSRKSDISPTLKENIQRTIGCEYELVIIDNSQNNYSIFTAYNEGVRRAKGDILCFMHDDIIYHTTGWGPIIEKHFRDDSEIGLIGFAGTHFLPNAPMYWFCSPFISEYNLTNDHGEIIKCFNRYNNTESPIDNVVAVDGFCFFIRKSIFSHIKFEKRDYPDFHGYDMDICMQIIQAGYKNIVTREILIEHTWSERDFNKSNSSQLLEIATIRFHNKWKNHLPLTQGIETIPPETINRINNLCIKAFESTKIRQSISYKLGHAIVAIPKRIIRLFKQK